MDTKVLLVIPAFAAAGYLLYLATKEHETKPSNIWGRLNIDMSIPNFTINKHLNIWPFNPDEVIGKGCIRLNRSAYVSALRNLDNIMAYRKLAEEASKKYGVPVALILAILGVESNGNPRAYRSEPRIADASRGLMQMLCRTARSLGLKGSCQELYKPEVSIDLGAKYLSRLYQRYGNWLDVIAAYNAGNISGKSGFGCYRNQLYVDKVVSYLKAFKDYGVFLT